MRHRASLVRLRTSIKNRVHALLTREGIQLPKLSDIFGKRGMEFLKGVKLQQQRRMALDNYLKVLEVLNGVIEEVESILEEKAEVTEEVKWLMSAPGIATGSSVGHSFRVREQQFVLLHQIVSRGSIKR